MRISDWSSDVCSSDLLVAVGDGAFPHIGDDFHVAVRVRVEAAAGTDGVVVPDPERADTHPLRIVVVAEAEVMAGGQPVDVEPAETADRTYLDHCRSPRSYAARSQAERKRGVSGKSVYSRVETGGSRIKK